MTHPLIENHKMSLNSIDELKEVDNIQEVNSLWLCCTNIEKLKIS
jgi:hypothetical protein